MRIDSKATENRTRTTPGLVPQASTESQSLRLNEVAANPLSSVTEYKFGDGEGRAGERGEKLIFQFSR